VESILDRLAAAPGVTAASASSGLPVLDSEPMRRFAVAGQPLPQPNHLPWAFEAATLGDYSRALELRMLEGRMWRAVDAASGWNVAVVNREAVRRYWPARSPIGEHLSIVDQAGRPAGDAIEIVGVVDNVLSASVDEPAPPRLYRPLARRPLTQVAFLIRGSVEVSALASSVREALRTEDRELAVSEVRTFAEGVKRRTRTRDLIMALFTSFAAIGLIVAITGVYGVTVHGEPAPSRDWSTARSRRDRAGRRSSHHGSELPADWSRRRRGSTGRLGDRADDA
jgi:hypothetical protein